MRYFFRSVATFSFWRYALFSWEALAKLLAAVGGIYVFMEMMDFLDIYTKAQYSRFAIVPIIVVAAIFVVVTRRPVSRITYRVSRKDYSFEVKVGDLLTEPGDVVISSNTTFDTNIASGLISPDSLQGQLAVRVFQGNTDQIDRQLGESLQGAAYTLRDHAPGKDREYEMGTVAKVGTPTKTYYFVAMSRLNDEGNARSTIRNIEDALDGVWRYVAERGELRTLVVPLIGTGRGRIELPRKKMVEKIAQSFADASRDKIFSNKLVIVVRPEDADRFQVNLFEIKDYLVRSLHT